MDIGAVCCMGMVVGAHCDTTVLVLYVVAHAQVSAVAHVCLACAERDKRTNQPNGRWFESSEGVTGNG